MPIIRKRKKFGTIQWSFDESLHIRTKKVHQTNEKIRDWPLLDNEEIIYRVNGIDHESFYQKLIKTTAKLQSTSLKFKLIWALKRYPDEESKIFSIYINAKELSDEEIELFHLNKLVLAYFAGFYVIARNQILDVNFLCGAIEFYERFDNLILSDKTQPFLLFGVKSTEELTLLYYSDVKGNGMLIKSKSSDNIISPELEIEILRLGSVIGVDVPKRAAVIMLDPEDDVLTEFSSFGSNILIQRLIPGAFPLYSASDDDISNLVENNCVNLGRMLIFDIISGSWDRHSGNYVLHPKDENPLKIRYSLSEIDFGHFNPEWYPSADFENISNEEIDEDNPPRISKREGWALTRHPLVTDMMKNCDKLKVVKGINQSFININKFLVDNEENLENYFSFPLLNRLKDVFKSDSKVRELLESELKNIEVFDQIDWNNL